MAVNFTVLEEVPSDHLYVQLDLDKLSPFEMYVPCIYGIGSCKYDVCNDVIPNNRAVFCAMGACQCPLGAKNYVADKIPFMLPLIGGRVFASILEGDYIGNITFLDDVTEKVYGCLGIKFTIKADVK